MQSRKVHRTHNPVGMIIVERVITHKQNPVGDDIIICFEFELEFELELETNFKKT